MPSHDIGHSHLDRVAIEGMDKTFIISNAALEKVLFNRNLVGREFAEACESATQSFLEHLSPELHEVMEDLAEMVILVKGLYYWTHNAFVRVFGRNLEANFADTNRVEFSSDGVRVDVRHFNFDAPTGNLIICDTLASGATMCAVLSRYLEHHQLQRVFVFSIAGSVVGGQALASFCRSHNIDLTVVYGLAAFGLAANGFDLSFLHPDTVTAQTYRDRATELFWGKPVSAVGWDFGSQAQAIRKYRMLCWIEARYWGLEDTDVFRQTEPPTDLRLVSKERAAYSERMPDVERSVAEWTGRNPGARPE